MQLDKLEPEGAFTFLKSLFFNELKMSKILSDLYIPTFWRVFKIIVLGNVLARNWE